MSCLLNMFLVLFSWVIWMFTTPPIGSVIIQIAKEHLEKGYLAASLDRNKNEILVVREDSFDCVTFVEYVFSRALADAYKKQEIADSFLLSLRYRDGKINGYESRLHYFTEWLIQAEKNGYGKNISLESGGKDRRKSIHYISSYSPLYAELKANTSKNIILSSEKTLSERPIPYIPKRNIHTVMPKLQDGDILAFTSSKPGLDIMHVGFVYRQKKGVHLIHASSKFNKTMISEKNIGQWALQTPGCDGLIVFRPSSSLSR